MKRVASLHLPGLAIQRLRRLDLSPSPPERRARPALPVRLALPVDDDPGACSVPRGGGWRPGARWARSDAAVAKTLDLPVHRQPLSSPPLILSRTVGQRQLVTAACPQAMALGLNVGMAVAQAQALVADLDARLHDEAADARLLERLAIHAAMHWTPVAAAAPPDGLWLDLTGTAHLFGGETRFCERVLAFLYRLGFTASIAVADTAGAAHGVARHRLGDVTIVPVGGTAQAVAPLPLSTLRLTDRALEAARRFGLERVGDLMALPRAPLARRLGQGALERLDQALGRVAEPIIAAVPETRIAAERRLVESIGTAEAIVQVVCDLVEDLVARLREGGLGARTLRLTCRRVDDTDQLMTFDMARATRDADHLRRLLMMRIDRIEPRFGIEVMRLDALRTEPLHATSLGVVLAGEPRTADLAGVLDQLAGRPGSGALFRATAVESDVPERSVARCNPLAEVQGWPTYPRPVRLLRRPEELAQVVALLPDAPPRRFRWRGQTHRIVAGDGPERIHGEWWRRHGEVWAVRDYFRVEDEQGGRFWVFRRGDGADPATGDLSWHMHGMFG